MVWLASPIPVEQPAILVMFGALVGDQSRAAFSCHWAAVGGLPDSE